MTKKEKEAKIKEMERFINEGVPEEARARDCEWEKEPEIPVSTIALKQRVNEKDNKKALDVVNSKEAKPVPSEDAVIKVVDDEKENKKTNRSKSEQSSR